MTNTTNRLATINTKDIHTPTRSITQWLYSLPYLHHPLHSSWQALIVLEGLDQGMELLLAAGDSTPTGDKGIIDWFRDPDMFGDEDLTRSFCQEIIDYAAIHNNFSLDRPAGETLRSLNWQIDEQEVDFGTKFAGIVSWVNFISCDNFTGTALLSHKPNVPVLYPGHNPPRTIPHCTTTIPILYTTLYGLCQQPSIPTPPTLLHSQQPALSPYAHAIRLCSLSATNPHILHIRMPCAFAAFQHSRCPS